MFVFSQDELDVIRMAKHIIATKFQRGAELTSLELVKDYLITGLAFEEQEVFRILLLDNQHRLITDVELARGDLGGATVSPRDVVKTALFHNAAAVFLAHNHPSGFAWPSQADRRITAAIKAALDMVLVRTLDHVIIGGTEIYSFAEKCEL